MSWVALVALLVAFALTPSLLDVFVLKSTRTGYYPDQASTTTLILSQSVALLIVASVVSVLRWWPVVRRETLRTRAWVWVVPMSVLVVCLVTTDYTRLMAAGPAIALSLLVGTMLIGAAEELMFRGVVLRFMRDRYRETIAAALTTVVFALTHFAGGPLQIVATLASGYVFYYTRRVSGGLLLPIIVHGMLDFSIYSGATTSNPSENNGAPATFLLVVVLALILILFHRFAEPKRADTSSVDSPTRSVK
jgi:membrane protease YdiL (CAAX protease family)